MKAVVSTYTSHGQTDIDLDASVIDRQELDKVNKILYDIEEATNLNDLPSDTKISGCDESQIPPHKNHKQVKILRNNRKIKLEQDAINKQARATAIRAVNY